jgi:prepilin-type processing-associated H-X9-DG protein
MTRHLSKNRWAFTLVELLVVIGIIALLISILLPALARAKKQAQGVQCSNNLRQLGTAILYYANNNDGFMPRPASQANGHKDDDFIWWQTKPILLDINKSALAPYLQLKDQMLISVFRCPTDIGVEDRIQTDPAREAESGGYKYSYSLNTQVGTTIRKRFASILSPSDKALMVEENGETINDANWVPATGNEEAVLSFRHGANSKTAGGGKGNVLFGDLHVESVGVEQIKIAGGRYFDLFKKN